MSSILADILADLIVDGIGALIRKRKSENAPAEYTVSPSWECPSCGTLNQAAKGVCENCGQSKPRSGKTIK